MTKIDLDNLDRRIAERMIRNGQLDENEWKKHLEALPDVEKEAEPFEAELETGVLEGREDAE